jgi:hypothetical protein
MNNINSKIQNIIEKIKSKYPDDLMGYYYIGPDDRSYLRIGHYIKYFDIEDPEYKLKSGFIVTITLDKLTLKSIGSNLFWKIKVNKNHIFFYEQSNTRFLMNEMVQESKKKKKTKKTKINTENDNNIDIDNK